MSKPTLRAADDKTPCTCIENDCGVIIPRDTLVYINTEQLAAHGALGVEHCDCIVAIRGPESDTIEVYYLELKNIGTKLLLKEKRDELESLAAEIARKIHNCYQAYAGHIEKLLGPASLRIRFVHAAAAVLPGPQLPATIPYSARAKLEAAYRALLATTRRGLEKLCGRKCRAGVIECNTSLAAARRRRRKHSS